MIFHFIKNGIEKDNKIQYNINIHKNNAHFWRFPMSRSHYSLNREQSFTKAAEKLFISQPCLSAAIKKIEEEIGMPLFERRYSAVRPTEIGRAYIETAERMMSLQRDFAAKLNDINAMESGSITIGGPNYASSYIIPPIVSRFLQLYPKINVSLVETGSVELVKKINEEEVDLVIDSDNEEKDYYD